jgi:hypothetical protein
MKKVVAIAIALALITSLAVGILGARAAQPCHDAELTLQPNSGPAGTVVRLEGGWFGILDVIPVDGITFGGAAWNNAEILAATGFWSDILVVPLSAAPGAYVVEVLSSTGCTAAAVFTVLPGYPAYSVDIPTEVNVTGGTTTPPIIKCKWEQDTTVVLEDGDPLHETPGSQFLPAGYFNGNKTVEYWAVVTDPEGVSTVDQVSVDVFYPLGPPMNGVLKYQVILHKVDRDLVGITALNAAEEAGLITYNTSPIAYDYDEVFGELDKGTAEVYMGSEDLHYHQPCGDYRVVADAADEGNAWAHENNTDLENWFTYLCVPKFEIDFSSLYYGDVTVCNEKWIAGDTVFDAPVAPAPSPNPATIRNIGNTDLAINVKQTDMGFGFSGAVPTEYQGPIPPPEGFSNWNVVFDARIGSVTANGMYYDPEVEVTLPNKLPLCNTDEFDYSIHIVKSTGGAHTGTMTIGCVQEPFR